MDCINRHVDHKKFGHGTIKELCGNTITVYFQEYGSHSFIYPDAFEKFLTACDPEFAQAVSKELDTIWEEQANRELQHRKEIQEMVRQAKQEKLVERKGKKTLARSK